MNENIKQNKIMPRAKKNQGTGELPFQQILSSIMEERGLTLKQVSELAGVRISVVQNWLECRTPHNLQAVSKLSKSLGISFKSLLLGETEVNNQPASVAEIFEEQDWFDGYAKIKISRLVPRKK